MRVEPSRLKLARPGHRLSAEQAGFTLVEVLVAALVLVVGILGLLNAIDVSNHADAATRVRQTSTSLAREVLEDARSLPYTNLASTSLATQLQPLVPGSSVSGTTLVVTRAPYTLTLAFTTCSLDDPSDGYGDHTQPPQSGGNWCPDVAPSGSSDSQPDDYKRVSVSVTPSSYIGVTAVQDTTLIYQGAANGPAVTCLTLSTCPGANSTITDPNTTSLTFNLTTTTLASSITWLVNGDPPPSAQIASGQSDPYTPSSTNSSFTWVLPSADGTYTISAIAYDANGHSGTRSTLQVTLNRHVVIAPATLTAGWDSQIHGVDIQWVPSVDQDVLYYSVYHRIGSGVALLVPGCSQVHGTTCTDTTAISPNPPAVPSTCSSASQSYTTANTYWVIGVDADPTTGAARASTQASPAFDANLCDHPPAAPSGLTGTLSSGSLNLSWSVPASPVDPDSWDSIQQWRIYRWAPSTSAQFPGSRLQLVGALSPSGGANTTAVDNSPDPGGVAQNYCVTSVDSHLDESSCSNVFSG